MQDANTPTWAALANAARTRFGIDKVRPGQRELIDLVFKGRNALGVMPTGSGKSLTFQLPALFLPKPTIVVSPLLALMHDQQQKLADAHIDAARLDSTLSRAEHDETLVQIRNGEQALIYVTPERLKKPECLALLRERGASLVVVDEAHCVSQWGHDFRPAYLAIRNAIQALGSPPVLALTATAPPDLASDILKQLGVDGATVVNTGIDRPNLFFEVIRTPSEDLKRIRTKEILGTTDGVGIIYVATVRLAEELYQWLSEGLSEGDQPVGRYHGKMGTRDREEAQDRFMRGDYKAIIATNAFGLGIDKPDVRFVIHYTFPDSLEAYYQEAGRAGRDGEAARAVLLYRLEDLRIQLYFLRGKYPHREELAKFYDQFAAIRSTSARAIAPALGLSERRARVIAALLESMGILERRGQKLVCVREFNGREELEAYFAEYESRHANDRARLDAIMHYAQTTDCRLRVLKNHFADSVDCDCGHCDNCRDQNARTLAPPEPPAQVVPPSTPAHGGSSEAPLFVLGQKVRHRRFGQGEVVTVEDEKAVVRFGRFGTKTVKVEYLRAS